MADSAEVPITAAWVNLWTLFVAKKVADNAKPPIADNFQRIRVQPVDLIVEVSQDGGTNRSEIIDQTVVSNFDAGSGTNTECMKEYWVRGQAGATGTLLVSVKDA